MITVVGMWEPSFSNMEQVIEYRMWKQTIAAFDVDRWVMVGEPPDPKITSFEQYGNLMEALHTCENIVFLIPDAEVELSEIDIPENVTFVFGNVSENLKMYATDVDQQARLATPKPIDMFAAACLPWVLSYGAD